MSNLEPFRWGDPDFVRQTVLNFVRIGIGGVHVYPLRYWDWPNSADNTTPLLQQTDRDWIWFASWARYAWNPERDPKLETTYWTTQFANRFAVPNHTFNYSLTDDSWAPSVNGTQARVPHSSTASSSMSGVSSASSTALTPDPSEIWVPTSRF